MIMNKFVLLIYWYKFIPVKKWCIIYFSLKRTCLSYWVIKLLGKIYFFFRNNWRSCSLTKLMELVKIYFLLEIIGDHSLTKLMELVEPYFLLFFLICLDC